jgi:hypothetical protein
MNRRKYYANRREVAIPYAQRQIINANANQMMMNPNVGNFQNVQNVQNVQNGQIQNVPIQQTNYEYDPNSKYQQNNIQQGIPINNVVLPQGQPYFPNDAAKQEAYGIHQSQMGGGSDFNNNRVIGQPPQNYYNNDNNNMGQNNYVGQNNNTQSM